MHALSLILGVALLATAYSKVLRPIVPFNNLGPRIINGQTASEGQFPWQAAIYVFQAGGTQLCGGALISDSWILTAGHCVQSATKFRIALGSNVLSGTDSNRVVLETSDYIQHEEYNSMTLANDIALIPLPEPVDFSDTIQPIELASSELGSGTVTTVSGWGLTSDGGDGASNDLNFVNLVTIETNDCTAAYGFDMNQGVVCAQGQGAEVQSTCEGDSGGPLVLDNGGTPVHVGVVSFGHSDGCESGKPVGFSITGYFREWIREKSGV